MAPRVDSMNVVVPDVGAAAAFLEALGAPIQETLPAWAPHHRVIPTGGDASDVDLDSPEFAHYWGGLPEGFTGVVVNLRVDARDEVDALYERALEHGATSRRAPYDAFWGARYAVVEGPGPIQVGVMSAIDADHRAAPPEIADFA